MRAKASERAKEWRREKSCSINNDDWTLWRSEMTLRLAAGISSHFQWGKELEIEDKNGSAFPIKFVLLLLWFDIFMYKFFCLLKNSFDFGSIRNRRPRTRAHAFAHSNRWCSYSTVGGEQWKQCLYWVGYSLPADSVASSKMLLW